MNLHERLLEDIVSTCTLYNNLPQAISDPEMLGEFLEKSILNDLIYLVPCQDLTNKLQALSFENRKGNYLDLQKQILNLNLQIQANGSIRVKETVELLIDYLTKYRPTVWGSVAPTLLQELRDARCGGIETLLQKKLPPRSLD